MKKHILSGFALILFGTALVSCDNGPYDANPKVDNSNILNPLNPNSGVETYIGTMKADFRDTNILFYPARYVVPDPNNPQVRAIIANRSKDTVTKHTVVISFSNYTGPKIYDASTNATEVMFEYQIFDTASNQFITYSPNTGNDKGKMTINVKGQESGNLRGTFNGILFRTEPVVVKIL